MQEYNDPRYACCWLQLSVVSRKHSLRSRVFLMRAFIISVRDSINESCMPTTMVIDFLARLFQ